ncbi:MAG: galactose mutarotase [Oscillospiraceae bacterium]|nr:galactose mutarotase [Oscillospiraceae bacterium]
MKIIKSDFGKMPDGRCAHLYTLENEGGLKAVISDLGGSIVNLFAPDRDGAAEDVVLGFRDFDGYLNNPCYFGALIGRNTNRIRDGRIEISGQVYELEKNNGRCNLHSGKGCIAYRLFEAKTSEERDSVALTLSIAVEDFSDGFPGNLDIQVIYTIDKENSLRIEYQAVSDKDTIINLTNHSYFNLAGHANGPIYEQILRLDSDYYSPNNSEVLPTGELLSVEGTPFDFRSGKTFGSDIRSDYTQIKMFSGYDHNFALNGRGWRIVGEASDPASGRVMEIWTDQPGVQLYTTNVFVAQFALKGDANYASHQAFCLETQTFPGAAELPWLTSPIYKAGQEYRTSTAFKFKR